MLINTYQPAMASARKLFDHVVTNLNLSEHYVLPFLAEPIEQPVQGLYVTDFPIWKLGCLLGEEWVEEDILNGMAELLYFQCAAAPLENEPEFIFLPTSFFNNAQHLYTQEPQLYSIELLELCERLCSTAFHMVSFIVWHDNHYVSYIYKKSLQLFHNDSLGHPPAPNVLFVFSWLLDSLDLPIPTRIQSGTISKQIASVGYGSCGIAAHNLIKADADDDKALRELIIFHLTAKTCGVSLACFFELLLITT
jgi:hypothetical protein